MTDRRDSFYWKAKENQFSSRAAFKLIEILKKFYISVEGKNVLEIGTSPGGWSEVVQMNNPASHICVDIKKEQNEIQYHFIKGDISREKTWEDIDEAMEQNRIYKFDLILSDAMSNTSGNGDIDHSSSYLICTKIMEGGLPRLSQNGNIIMKQFQGDLTNSFIKEWNGNFRKITITKPNSSRQTSR
ncbi:MAG: SAM-dependent methyltransferase, partial [Thermoplasmataceae archaeon]